MKPRAADDFLPLSPPLPPTSPKHFAEFISMGFLCLCFGSSPGTKDTAHRSYVRVIDVPPPYSDHWSIARMPEKMRSTASFEPLIEFSQKEVDIEVTERPSSSSSSSVVSMPSTNLTSNPTGSTVARHSVLRGDTGSTAPPSYHSASRSPSPDAEAPSTLLLHPVMSDDWFRRLQQRALDATTRPESP